MQKQFKINWLSQWLKAPFHHLKQPQNGFNQNSRTFYRPINLPIVIDLLPPSRNIIFHWAKCPKVLRRKATTRASRIPPVSLYLYVRNMESLGKAKRPSTHDWVRGLSLWRCTKKRPSLFLGCVFFSSFREWWSISLKSRSLFKGTA